MQSKLNKRTKRNFLIVSAYGYGNVGDDICAHSGKYLVETVAPFSKVKITSPPYNPLLVRRASHIILSGGGIIYDRVSENVENYLKYLRYGQTHRKQTAAIGLGVQGIVTDTGKKAYKSVLNKTQLVTTRSKEDKSALEKVGVSGVIATQDLGFLADEWAKTPILVPRLAKTPRPKLGLALMDVRFLQAYKSGNKKLRAYIKIVEKNMAQLSKEFDIWLFSHSNDDEKWRAQLAKKHNLSTVNYKSIKDFSKFFYTYKQMDLIVGVRFHSVVLGMLAHKPVIGIGSKGAKLDKLAKEAPGIKKQIYSIGNTNELSNLFKNLKRFYMRKTFKILPEQQLAALKSKAEKNADLLKKSFNL